MSTAVFSTCDVKFWRFAVSTFLTLPKQLILVYLGVLLVQSQDDSTIKDALFAVAGLVTVLAGVWIWFKMKKYKTQLLEEQAQRHQRKEAERLGLTRSDSGFTTMNHQSAPDYPLGDGGNAGQDPMPMPMPTPLRTTALPTTTATATTVPSPTNLGYGAWQQQPESPMYEPYRAQYDPPTTAPYGAPYGHYEQDSFYHGANDSGDVGMALSHPTAYETSESLGGRQADTLSVENGRPAQSHTFV